MRIRFVDEIDIELRWRVRVHRDVIFRKIGIHDSAGRLIWNGRFEQRVADSEEQPAHDLATGQLRINHPPRVVNAGRAFHSRLSKNIDVHLDENRAVRKERELFAFFLVRFGGEFAPDRCGQTR